MPSFIQFSLSLSSSKGGFLLTYQQQLPVTFDETTHPYVMRLSMAYRPYYQHNAPTDLTSNDIKHKTYVGIKSLSEQCGYDYDKRVNRYK